MHSTARALVVTVTKDVREEGNDPSAGRRARSSAEGLNSNAVVVHRVLQSEAAVDRTVTIGGEPSAGRGAPPIAATAERGVFRGDAVTITRCGSRDDMAHTECTHGSPNAV